MSNFIAGTILGIIIGFVLFGLFMITLPHKDQPGFEAGYRKGIMETEEIRTIYLKQDSLNTVLKNKKN